MTAATTAPTTNLLKSAVITNLDATPILRPTIGAGAFGRVVQARAVVTPAAAQATTDLIRCVRIPSNLIVTKLSVILDAAVTTLTGAFGLWFSDDTRDGTNPAYAGGLTAISSNFFSSALAMATFAYVPGTDPANVIGLSAPVDLTFSDNSTTFSQMVDLTFAASGLAFVDANYIPSQSIYPIWQAVANLLALQTTPTGPFTQTSIQPHFQTASAGASVYVRSDDPGGYFDIGYQESTIGSSANKPMTVIVDGIMP